MLETPPRLVQHDLQNGVLVLTIQARQIEGEEIAAELRRQLIAAVEEYDQPWVVIDLQHIQYISSVALSPLLTLRKKLRERHGQIIICNLSRSVGDVFYATKLVSSAGDFSAPFEMAPDVPTAVARLSGAALP
jgi:anti-anti-sigma factor